MLKDVTIDANKTGMTTTNGGSRKSNMDMNQRKLLRRAANRRSAQLSRARKKAHVEELKKDNSKLQRLVDILDSEPELVLSLNPKGKITYISQRSENYVLTNLYNKSNKNGESSQSETFGGTALSSESSVTMDNGDFKLTHLDQILCSSSVAAILKAVEEVIKYSSSVENETLFASKKVKFREEFNCPLVGQMRLSKLVRRNVVYSNYEDQDDCSDDEKGNDDEIKEEDSMGFKKVKTCNFFMEESKVKLENESKSDDMNLSNFLILTEAASTLMAGEDVALFTNEKSPTNLFSLSGKSSDKSSTGKGKRKKSENETSAMKPNKGSDSPKDYNIEFVCVIRAVEQNDEQVIKSQQQPKITAKSQSRKVKNNKTSVSSVTQSATSSVSVSTDTFHSSASSKGNNTSSENYSDESADVESK